MKILCLRLRLAGAGKVWEAVKRTIQFLKEEAVLCIALLLAVSSAFWVRPDREYLEYIDFRTLGILFCLMCVMAGLGKTGIFQAIAQGLLRKVKNVTQLVLILVLLCFFFSMAITNDVALITFVPFTFTVLRLLKPAEYDRLLIPVVVLQTIAANLGSMLTPIGNPQNLYLYGLSGMGLLEFVGLMLPYTAVSLVLLIGWCLLAGGRKTGGGKARAGEAGAGDASSALTVQFSETVSLAPYRKQIFVYLLLFITGMLTVARVLPFQAAVALTAAAILLMDWRVLLRVDYSLLLTFVGFFVFIGNMGRIPLFKGFLEQMIAEREVMTAVVSSQVISNVPAALLLSGFTDKIQALIVGTNLGGLGTLIASMASLISFKYMAKEAPGRGGRYLAFFTAANVIFLAVLLTVYFGLS